MVIIMSRTIKVTGKGRLSLKPDTICLTITQEATVKEYEEAVRGSAESKNALDEGLSELGFKKQDIKTINFNIDTVYENYQASDKSWKNRLVGYRYVHSMRLQFAADNELLGRVMYALAHSSGEPHFTISYTVSDVEAAKNELLARAVADSKGKAEVLAKAAGVELGELLTVDYSWDEIEFVSRPMNRMAVPKMATMSMADNSYEIGIEAEDINVEDNVTLVWEIR